MSKSISTFCIVFFFLAKISAQDKFSFPKSSDLGLNITNVLSSFIGNSNGDLDIESFPFMVKINRKNNAIRFGLGLNLVNSNELLTDVEQFILNNFQISGRVGFERKKYIGNKFGFFYGLDVISTFRNEESTFSNNVDITNIIENTLGFGGGPVYGFEYYLNKFMYLGAEGSFYGIYTSANRKEIFEFNPTINSERQTSGFNARLTAPTRLYIMVRF
jgi:hypothetical protein